MLKGPTSTQVQAPGFQRAVSKCNQLTVLGGDAVLGVPLVVALAPGQLGRDGREQVEERVGDQHVVIRVDEQQHHDDSVPDPCRG